MGRFVYSLDRVLELRKLEQRKLEFRSGPVVLKINACREDIQNAKSVRDRTFEHCKNLQLSSQKMVQYLSYTRDMSIKKIRAKQDDLQRYEKQYEQEYADLIRQAKIRRRSLEILREKKLLEHRKKLQKNEEKETEDYVLSRK